MNTQTLMNLRKSYQKDLKDALDRITNKLSENPNIHKVVLFGSYAIGRCDLLTDIDLLIVMDSDKDFVTRTAELYASLQAGVDLDLLVYTPKEYEQTSKRPFLRNALSHGKVLYEKRQSE